MRHEDVNELYLNPVIMDEMRNNFRKDGVLLIPEFLKKDLYERMKQNLFGSPLQEVFVADKYSFTVPHYSGPPFPFVLKDFIEYVGKITGKRPK